MPGIIDHAISKVSTLLGISTSAASSTLAAILDSREQERIAQVRRNWNMYGGRHYDYEREDGEMPYINMAYGAVEKSISWLVGKGPVVRARDDIQPIITELTSEIIENSGGESFFYEAAQQGAVSGDCLIQIGFDPNVNFGQGGIAMRVMDSERSFWEYKNVGQRKRLTRVMIIWDELDQDGTLRTFSEVWSDDEVRVYPPGASLSVRDVASMDGPPAGGSGKGAASITTRVDDDGSEYAVYPNPYGELPFVHIPNMLISQHVHGRSDLHDLWILNKEMDEALLQYKDNVDYHGNPLTLLFGISAKDVEKGANKVWGNLPKDSRVENLEVTQTYEQVKDYLSLLERYAGLVSSPTHLYTLETEMKIETSAAAMRLAFLPLIELTARKRKTYGPGFKEALEKALRFMNTSYELNLEELDGPTPQLIETLDPETGNVSVPLSQDLIGKLLVLRTRPYYDIQIEFQDHLPRNRTLELADIESELRMKLESLIGALKRLGVENPEQKLNEVSADQKYLGLLERVYMETSGQAEVQESQQGGPPTSDGSESSSPRQDKFVDDSRGGRGRKKRKENANQVENRTGQSAERTSAQRTARGKGDI